MKTKLGWMVACATVALAANTGTAQSVIWVGGGGFSFSFGMPCPPPPVVTYVPVVVTEPACPWGLGTRTVVVTSPGPRFHGASPYRGYHRAPAVACAPYGRSSAGHRGYRPAPAPRGHRR